MFLHKFNDTILRKYDIRGIYNKTLFDDDAFALGLGFGRMIFNEILIQPTIVVGYDARTSCESLRKELIDGLIKSGSNVINVGLAHTPMVHFAVKQLNAHAGIMITGSHNPPEYNGFKLFRKKGDFYDKDIVILQEILKIGIKRDIPRGTEKDVHIINDYIANVFHDINFTNKKMKIVWDCGNGVVANIIHNLQSHIQGEHINIYDVVDGLYPNHLPDPSEEKNMEDLKTAVVSNKADIGIAFDGDGDRVGIITNNGEFVRGDNLLAILSKYLLNEHHGATIACDVKCGDILLNEIEKHGGKCIMTPTGHPYIKKAMRQHHALLGGEMSGHFCYKDKYHGFDDGVYAAIRIIEILSNSDQTISQIYQSLPKIHSTNLISIPVDESKKFSIINDIIEYVKNNEDNFNTMDGVRVRYPFGWYLIRASNTEPKLALICEADSDSNLQTLLLQCKIMINKFTTW